MFRIKRAAAIALTLSLCIGAAVLPVSANSVDQDSEAGLSTAITFEYKNDPTYTVVIPESITLTKDGTDMTLSAEDVANLDNQKVSVTIAGTDKFRDQMLIDGKTADGKNASMRYQFVAADGTVYETKPDNINGTELAAFTENGAVTYTVKPVLSGSSSIKKGVVYTGTIEYGIELVSLT